MKIGKLNLFSDFHFQIENEKWKSPSNFRFPFQIRKGNLNCGIVHVPACVLHFTLAALSHRSYDFYCFPLFFNLISTALLIDVAFSEIYFVHYLMNRSFMVSLASFCGSFRTNQTFGCWIQISYFAFNLSIIIFAKLKRNLNASSPY